MTSQAPRRHEEEFKLRIVICTWNFSSNLISRSMIDCCSQQNCMIRNGMTVTDMRRDSPSFPRSRNPNFGSLIGIAMERVNGWRYQEQQSALNLTGFFTKIIFNAYKKVTRLTLTMDRIQLFFCVSSIL